MKLAQFKYFIKVSDCKLIVFVDKKTESLLKLV